MIFPLRAWKNDPSVPRRLERCRQELRYQLQPYFSRAIQERVLLATHEILGNILRHGMTKPGHIHLDFTTLAGQDCWVLRDDGSPFTRFAAIWQEVVENADRHIMDQGHRGLAIVARLWPHAYYLPHSHDTYNRFVLPMAFGQDNVPAFFRMHAVGKVLVAESGKA